jgi:N6-adenosine-specific RNA methylase IME4
MSLPDKKYNLIYADPPWMYENYNYSHTKKGSRAKRGCAKEYGLMTLEEIKALPVDRIAATDCLLAMWWVPPLPQEALDVVRAWGFTIKTMKGFVWRKTTVNGKEHFGMGNYTRCNSEDCLFAVKGKPKRVNKGIRQFIHAQIREHSRKPDEGRNNLVDLMGDVPRIELFARQASPGWDAWGNGLPSKGCSDNENA